MSPVPHTMTRVKSVGGINVSNLGLAARYKNKLYFGVAMNYHFGTIEEQWMRTFPDLEDVHCDYRLSP